MFGKREEAIGWPPPGQLGKKDQLVDEREDHTRAMKNRRIIKTQEASSHEQSRRAGSFFHLFICVRTATLSQGSFFFCCRLVDGGSFVVVEFNCVSIVELFNSIVCFLGITKMRKEVVSYGGVPRSRGVSVEVGVVCAGGVAGSEFPVFDGDGVDGGHGHVQDESVVFRGVVVGVGVGIAGLCVVVFDGFGPGEHAFIVVSVVVVVREQWVVVVASTTEGAG